MGLLYPHLVAVFFDSSGDLLKKEERMLSFQAQRVVDSGAFRVSEKGFQEKMVKELTHWQKMIGFAECRISVKPFFFHDERIGIEDMPFHLREVIEHPDLIEDGDPFGLASEIKRWTREGDYVFWWCEDYYIDKKCQKEFDANLGDHDRNDHGEA